MSLVWVNGSLTEDSSASVSIRDSGLLHAVGVFTTMRARNGNVFRLMQHLQRVTESCAALAIPTRYSDEELSVAVQEVLDANKLTDARLRLTMTGGTGADGPMCFLTAAELGEYPTELYHTGMTVMLLDEQKLNPFDIQAGHKTLNYLSRMAALRQARQSGAGEALWFNIYNYLQSGSISNIFIVSDGKLVVPPTQTEINADANLREKLPYARSNVLPGVTRQAVLELAGQAGISIELAAITVEQLLDADEVFLTNSIIGVMPVARIERSVVGTDKPGAITQRIAEAFGALEN